MSGVQISGVQMPGVLMSGVQMSDFRHNIRFSGQST